MFKEGLSYKKTNGIYCILSNNNTRWCGDTFAFMYDWLMKKSVFPRLFNSSYEKHNHILKTLYKTFHDQKILELGTGSGNAARLLPTNNEYWGIDIGKKLLKKAKKEYSSVGFKKYELVLTSADNLPFKKNVFDVCICNLSLNFFSAPNKVVSQMQQVLKPGGVFFCSVPIQERKESKKEIRGTQFTEQSLKKLFYNFKFESIQEKNGALLYFRATRVQEV